MTDFQVKETAYFSYAGAPENGGLKHWLRNQLPGRLKIVADGLGYDEFVEKFRSMRGLLKSLLPESITNLLPFNAELIRLAKLKYCRRMTRCWVEQRDRYSLELIFRHMPTMR
jgi:hypothetical protein